MEITTTIKTQKKKEKNREKFNKIRARLVPLILVFLSKCTKCLLQKKNVPNVTHTSTQFSRLYIFFFLKFAQCMRSFQKNITKHSGAWLQLSMLSIKEFIPKN